MLVKKTKNPESWSGMLLEKDLDQKGETWKLIKGNLTKMDCGGQKGENLTVNTHPNRKNQYGSPAGSNTTSASRRKKNFLLSWQQLSQWETVTTQPLKSQPYLELPVSSSFITVPPDFQCPKQTTTAQGSSPGEVTKIRFHRRPPTAFSFHQVLCSESDY